MTGHHYRQHYTTYDQYDNYKGGSRRACDLFFFSSFVCRWLQIWIVAHV